MRGDGDALRKKYFKDFTGAFTTADALGIGTEVDVMSTGLDEGASPDAIKALVPIAEAYIDFGKALMQLKTPNEAAIYALSLANSADMAGTALKKVADIYSDSLSGMIGVDDYFTAYNTFDTTAGRMADYLSGK